MFSKIFFVALLAILQFHVIDALRRNSRLQSAGAGSLGSNQLNQRRKGTGRTANQISAVTASNIQGNSNNGAANGTANQNTASNNQGNSNNGAVQNDFCAANFPNLAPTNGTQNTAGSCSSTVQGAIPSTDRMVSTLITAPENGAKINAGVDNTVTLETLNLDTGFFSNAQTQYYAEPQQLNANGIIKGHQHVTVQQVGAGNSALDPREFAFFKGLNDPAANGALSVDIPAGTLKQNGVYRICTITGTFTHQPVIMPVAQRGSQDDCIRVSVTNTGAVAAKGGKVPVKDDVEG